MFYIANAALLNLGYKTGSKIVHKVTSDALIVLLLERLKEKTVKEYEQTKLDAQELAMINSEQTIQEYEFELKKRSRFQYEMTTDINKKIAETSLKRAKNFTMEIKKLMQSV